VSYTSYSLHLGSYNILLLRYVNKQVNPLHVTVVPLAIIYHFVAGVRPSALGSLNHLLSVSRIHYVFVTLIVFRLKQTFNKSLHGKLVKKLLRSSL